MTFEERYESYKDLVEQRLDSMFPPEDVSGNKLRESMRYSVMAGGKRLRPIMTLEFARLAGGEPERALEMACAVELLHTYSLIHDDLPCMDDDSYRRGRPTNHRVYGEMTAVLAGDALQAEAFRTICRSKLGSMQIADCAGALAEAASSDGICGGQLMDMEGEGRELCTAELLKMYSMKTAELFKAACLMGVFSGLPDEMTRRAAQSYGIALGTAFQLRDDMLDMTATRDKLGKDTGTDAARNKKTLAALLGLDACGKLVDEYTDAAVNALEKLKDKSDADVSFLEELAFRLAGREV